MKSAQADFLEMNELNKDSPLKVITSNHKKFVVPGSTSNSSRL